jgi:hypothetical protein
MIYHASRPSHDLRNFKLRCNYTFRNSAQLSVTRYLFTMLLFIASDADGVSKSISCQRRQIRKNLTFEFRRPLDRILHDNNNNNTRDLSQAVQDVHPYP